MILKKTNKQITHVSLLLYDFTCKNQSFTFPRICSSHLTPGEVSLDPSSWTSLTSWVDMSCKKKKKKKKKCSKRQKKKKKKMPRQKQKRRDLKLKSTCDAAGGVLIHAEVCNFPVVIFSPRDSHSVSVDSELLSRTRRTSFLNRARVQNLRQPCDPPPLRLRVQTQQHDRLHTCRAGWWEGKVTPHGNPKIKNINTDVRLHQSVSAGGCRGRQLSGMSKCQVFILNKKKKKKKV